MDDAAVVMRIVARSAYGTFVLWVAGFTIPVAFVVALMPIAWGYAGMAYTTPPSTDPSLPAMQTGPVTFLDPSGPAYAAGIRSGDRIVQTLGSRAIDDNAGPVGTRITYRVVRSGFIRNVPVTFVQFTGALAAQEQFTKILGALTAIGACIVAILVMLRARERDAGERAAAFLVLAAAVSLLPSIALVCVNAWAAFFTNLILPGLAGVAALWVALSLLAMYPPPRSRLRDALVFAGPLAFAWAVLGASITITRLWIPAFATAVFHKGNISAVQIAFNAVLAVQIIAAMGAAKGSYRAPMRWLGGMWTVGLFLQNLPQIVRFAGSSILLSHYGDSLKALSVFCFAFGVAYPVLRHRLVDLNILISRATVYAIVSAIIVGVFIAAEWALGKIFEHSLGFSHDGGGIAAQLISLVLVLALGISARSIHRFVEERLSNTFFRRRMQGLSAIERLAQEADAATELRAFTDLAARKVVQSLETGGAAFYFREGERYVRSSHAGAHVFAPIYGFNDEAPLALRRWHRPFESDDISEPGQQLLFLPMSLRGDVIGFLCCAAKADRTAFLTDETAALLQLADRTGIASALLVREPVGTLAPGALVLE